MTIVCNKWSDEKSEGECTKVLPTPPTTCGAGNAQTVSLSRKIFLGTSFLF